MNDPIILAAAQPEDRRGTPDTNAPDDVVTGGPGGPGAPDAPEAPEAPDALGHRDARPIRTLLETAVTCRPIEEVTALVNLLKEDGRLPDAGHEALRTAAVTRPVQDVHRMVALLGESPNEVAEADITLRAAAVGRSIEDVALLVTILGTDEPGVPNKQDEPAEPGELERRRPAGAPAPAAQAKPVVAVAPAEPYEEPYRLPYRELHDAPRQEPPRRTAPVAAAAGSAVLRHVLRWPVAIALLVSGALHLPKDLSALPSATPAALLPLLVTALCLGAGALLALRDTPAVWRAGAATALGVVAVHVLGGSAGFDPLHGAVGGSVAWAGLAVVLCAASVAVLSGVALRNRQES
ncbi:hypothetical protein AB0892_15290 [Streptomyces sp. NPDC005409]|uniref:hypothetical protein n=1 Tax=Streptomyces sp. NPDC005409 TaxID=3155342 RepID=UPI003452EF9A